MKSLLLMFFACGGDDKTDPIDETLNTTTDTTTETNTDTDTDDQVEVVQPWPDWAYHHWVWEDESTEDSLLEMVDGYAAHDIPVGAVIIDSPWATGYNTYIWDTELFPDPQGLIDELHRRDIRVMLWTVPAINVDAEGIYEEAAAKGYFLTEADGVTPMVFSWWKGDGSLIDYFNADAVAWWHDLMQPVLDMGIDGWKCDAPEANALLLADAYSPGLGADVTRFEYSRAYYDDFFYHTREVLGDDRLITARPIDNYNLGVSGDEASWASVEINWAGWVGDQDPDFPGLAAALNNMYWSADYGYVAFGSDIGGYRSDDTPSGRGKEVFIRWAQMGALSPVMENGGSGVHWPWLFDDETVTIYRHFTELHYKLLPYLHREASIAFSEGRSVFRFTDDEKYSYLLGPDIFVAPILQPDGVVDVKFPQGDWVYLFDQTQTYSSAEVVAMQLPLDEFPVFVRSGSDVASTLLD